MFMLLIALVSSAQDHQGFRFGVRVNAGLSNVKEYEWDKITFGYGIRWIAEYNCTSKLYLQSGIGLENIAKLDLSERVNAYYLQIPVHVGYRYIRDDNKAFFFQAGPTLGIGLFGSKFTLYGQGPRPYLRYFEDARRLDLGVGGRIGVELKKFQISVGANYGLIRVFDNGGHNLSINLGIAYMFR